jgi:putative membrane protein
MKSEASMTATLPDATKLAIDRTRLAHERTLMAWVRTATSLISFGFTIYKFFEYLRENSKTTSPPGTIGPRELAVIMIAIGLGSLVIATIQHRRELMTLRAQYGAVVPLSLATVTATLIGLLGVVLLLAVVFRM